MRLFRLVVVVSAGGLILRTVTAQTADNPPAAVLLTTENIVDIAPRNAAWAPATAGQNELTETEILPPRKGSAKPTLNLKQGSTYFFSREAVGEVQLETPAANGAIRGTEFVATVAANGKTTVTMLDGELELYNAQGSVLVHSGEQANAEPGRKPTKTAVIEAINIIQWCLYYPGVLDLNELGFSAARRASNASLAAYTEGDLLAALKTYRGGAGSNADKVYHAGLLLAVGQVAKANRLLSEVSPRTPGRASLLTLIAAVTLKARPNVEVPRTASDWIAESYYRQSKADLPGALEAAQRATEIDPARCRIAVQFRPHTAVKRSPRKGAESLVAQPGGAFAAWILVQRRK